MNGKQILTALSQGLFPGVPREDYDLLERTNWSKLKAMLKSPAHFHHGLLDEEEDTDAKKTGRAYHVAVFEPERFRAHYVMWDGDRRAGKIWEAFKEEHTSFGREILTESEFKLCLDIQAAVRNNHMAAPYLSGGKGEVTMLWSHEVKPIGPFPGYSIACKARPDFLADLGAIVDLKGTRDASKEGFGRECWKYRYDAQAAMYVDGHEAATGMRMPYVLVAVEKSPPYVVQVYRVPEHVLQLGRDAYRAALQRLHECRATSKWPGYGEGELELELPRWAFPIDEDDATGMDLVIGGVETNGL